MPPINPLAAKECVKEALKRIADFSGDIESFTFNHWHEFHKTVFINAVAVCVRKKGSRIVLNEGMLKNFENIGEFIDFVREEAAFLGEPKPELREREGDLS